MRSWRVPYPKFGAGPGLERVKGIASRLGIDLSMFGDKGAVVVGSNGKGSTAAMTAALLRQAEGRVGLFTSPHLFDINERFRIDDEDISDEQLEHHWVRVTAAAAGHCRGGTDELGGFEFLFLIAADWFAAQGCARTVWEAGIGGRLDPVRLIAARRLALTSLDLEHTELLGPTLEDIARDKLDAAPAGSAVYIGSSCSPQRAVITAHCKARHISSVFVDASLSFKPPLLGAHQRENAALALALARDALGSSLTDAMVVRGLETTRWPGRLEIIEQDPLIVIDVGHTPAAIEAALAGFWEICGDQAAVLVCGASLDKEVTAIAALLARTFSVVICTSARHKGAPASLVAKHVAAANPTAEIVVADSCADARTVSLARARATGAAIYVAGGLFLAAEFKAVHLGRDAATLAFF